MDAPLEVVDPGAPGIDASLLRMVASRTDRGRVLVLGTAGDADRVRGCGLDVAGRVAVGKTGPRGWTRSIGRRLACGDLGRSLRTWSESSLAAIVPLLGDGWSLDAMIAAVGPRPPLVEPWHRRRATVRPLGLDLGPRLARRGWKVGASVPIADVPPYRLPFDRASTRGRDQGEFVVAVPVEPIDALDPWTLVGALASVAVSGRPIVVVLPRRGEGWTELGRWLCGMVPASAGASLRLVVDPRVEDAQAISGEVDVAALPVRPERVGDASLVTARSWLAAGVPVLGVASHGFGVLVEDGVDGRLLPAGEANAWARAMLRLADDPALREDMAHAAAARHGGRRSCRGESRSEAQVLGKAAMNVSAASR